jgi:hypothetical protein
MVDAILRPAISADVLVIVGLLADDELGATREEFRDPLPESYLTAFAAIDKDLFSFATDDLAVDQLAETNFWPG